MSSAHKAPDPDLILANHSFPGPYIIKAFGPENGQFSDEIREAVVRASLIGTYGIRERRSSKGASVCLTIEFHAQSVDEVVRMYE